MYGLISSNYSQMPLDGWVVFERQQTHGYKPSFLLVDYIFWQFTKLN